MDEKLLAATLSRYASFYNVKFFEITEEYGSLTALYEKFLSGDSAIPAMLKAKLISAWTKHNLTAMQKLLQEHDITSLLYNAPGYPAALYNMVDPPYVIYAKGQIDVLDNLAALACVGTRAMTSYGKTVVYRLISPLKRYPVCVVSGLALGIDGEVHRLCLDNNITTAAVLGGGLDRYEPLTNAHIANKMVAAGCLLSEYPPGVRPQKHHFLERNRIIAALAQVTVVVEGKIHSGALVTARCALQNGREVGAVPGEITSANAEGPNALLADGACLIQKYEDILALIGLPVEDLQAKKHAANQLHALLLEQPNTLDNLSAALKISAREAQQQITALELEGLVSHDARGMYFVAS